MLSSDLVRRLAADPLTALVPTVVLCPETDPRIRLRLRAAGATSVLDVPLDVRALLDSVARHLPSEPVAG
jgi:CheY-like chemotaxis protein